MSVKDFNVELVERSDIREFVEKWHYSKSINGLKIDYCFGMYRDGELIGAMIYGLPAMNNQAKKYSPNAPDKLLELRRLCCIDDTPKNTESYFIGRTLKWLKQNTDIEVILSYSDLTHGHTGVIYKASNFTLVGQSPAGRMIQYGDRLYHDKTIRTKYKGKLKPFAKRVKDALENGTAYYVKTKPKNIYIYKLRKV